MPLIDIALLIVFAAAAITGYRKGFIAQASSLAAIIVAVIACRTLGPAVTDIIMPGGEDETSPMPRYSAAAIAYCGVYLVAYYGVILVARLLKLVTHTLFLGPLDRMGGAVVSILKWGLAVSLAFNLYLAIWPDGKLLSSSTIAEGRPVEWIVGLAPKALGLISHGYNGLSDDKPTSPEHHSVSSSTQAES